MQVERDHYPYQLLLRKRWVLGGVERHTLAPWYLPGSAGRWAAAPKPERAEEALNVLVPRCSEEVLGMRDAFGLCAADLYFRHVRGLTAPAQLLVPAVLDTAVFGLARARLRRADEYAALAARVALQPAVMQARDAQQRTPLMVACCTAEAFLALLPLGRLDERDGRMRTVLHHLLPSCGLRALAAALAHPTCTQDVLDAADADGRTPVGLAVGRLWPELVHALLARGATVTQTHVLQATQLAVALGWETPAQLEMLCALLAKAHMPVPSLLGPRAAAQVQSLLDGSTARVRREGPLVELAPPDREYGYHTDEQPFDAGLLYPARAVEPFAKPWQLPDVPACDASLDELRAWMGAALAPLYSQATFESDFVFEPGRSIKFK